MSFVTFAALIFGAAVAFAGAVIINGTEEKPVVHPPSKAKRIIYNARKGVITAYFREDLPSVKDGNLLLPRPGVMVFTDDQRLPRTGSYADLERLAAMTDRALDQEDEYAFHTVGRSDIPFHDDVTSYGHHVVRNFDQAIARGKRLATAA